MLNPKYLEDAKGGEGEHYHSVELGGHCSVLTPWERT